VRDRDLLVSLGVQEEQRDRRARDARLELVRGEAGQTATAANAPIRSAARIAT